MEEADKVTRI